MWPCRVCLRTGITLTKDGESPPEGLTPVYALQQERGGADNLAMQHHLEPTRLPPAGWYADPDDTTALRWWDGTRWTEDRRKSGWQPAPLSTTPQTAPPISLGAKIVLVIVALVLAGGILRLFGIGDSAGAEWTGVGRVCDFDGECQSEFKCRSMDGEVQIYLPYGSFATGNEGWRWHEDAGERCGRPPA